MQDRRSGMFFLLSLFSMTAVLALSLVGLSRTLAETKAANAFMTSTQTVHLAEAGLDDALRAFVVSGGTLSAWEDGASDPNCPPGATCRRTQLTLLPGMTTTTLVINPASQFPTIHVTCAAAGSQRRLEATIEVTRSTPTRGVLITDHAPPTSMPQHVHLSDNAIFEGDVKAYVGSADAVQLDTGARVRAVGDPLDPIADGDVAVGPLDPGVTLNDAVVLANGPGQVDGRIVEHTDTPPVFPDVVVPGTSEYAACLQQPMTDKGANNQYNVSKNATVEFAGGVYHFGGLAINDGGTLIFNGPATLCLDKDLVLQQGTNLIFRSTTPSTIYVANLEGNAEAMYVAYSSTIMSQPTASAPPVADGVRLNFGVQGTTLTMKWDASIYGSIYAPYQYAHFTGFYGQWKNSPPKEIRGISSLTVSQLLVDPDTAYLADQSPLDGSSGVAVKLRCWRMLP